MALSGSKLEGKRIGVPLPHASLIGMELDTPVVIRTCPGEPGQPFPQRRCPSRFAERPAQTGARARQIPQVVRLTPARHIREAPEECISLRESSPRGLNGWQGRVADRQYTPRAVQQLLGRLLAGKLSGSRVGKADLCSASGVAGKTQSRSLSGLKSALKSGRLFICCEQHRSLADVAIMYLFAGTATRT
jgi:hypothetical protein